MKLIKSISVLILLALLAGCGISIGSADTIEMQTFSLNEPAADGVMEVKFTMGAGKIELMPGATGLVEGTVKYNVKELEPGIERKSGYLGVVQTSKVINIAPGRQVVNDWSFRLGDFPLRLVVEAGASEEKLDLGGIPLKKLYITDGASNARVTFVAPNPQVMEELFYRTGASSVELIGLANANFQRMELNAGAGSYKLDFSGQLRMSSRVDISAGVSDVTIACPPTTLCRVVVTGELNAISQQGTWLVTDKTYQNTGSGFEIAIYINMNVGSITLISN